MIVSLQIAMALSMLISAALLVQSLRSFHSVNPGFRADNLLLASLDPAAGGYDSTRIDGFWRATLEHVGHIPGVQSVSLARTVPLVPGRQRQPWVNPASGEKIRVDTNFVGPRYFQTLGIPLRGGREFSEDDGTSVTAGGDRERASRADVLAGAGSHRQRDSPAGFRETRR